MADALPFPVCISARTDVEHGQQFIEDVSIARGNMVLADHGLTTRQRVARQLSLSPRSSVRQRQTVTIARCVSPCRCRRASAPACRDSR